MKNSLYRKLAWTNIKNNKNTYFPYIFSSIVMVALFYILYAITYEVDRGTFFGDVTMATILHLGVYMTALFSVVFIFYINSFLLKRRQKELGLYRVLGMEKIHINKVLFYEVIYSGGFSIIAGILFGVLFSKLMFAILLNMLNLDTAIKLTVSLKPILSTIVLFLIIYSLEIIFNIISINRINPIDLLTGGQKGEKDPKSNWILGLVGLVSLGLGYYKALSIENPIIAIDSFFLSVLLVAAGTYFIFTSGSIVLLKMLKKNKKFYYNKKNFISTSNMIYRMKQNAVGLSNIAILSTAVLLVLSTTISLYVGIDDSMTSRYPKEVMTHYIYQDQDKDEIESVILQHGKEENVSIKDPLNYLNTNFLATFKNKQLVVEGNPTIESIADIYAVGVFTLEDYNRIHAENLTLNKGEVLISTNTKEFNNERLILLDKEYTVKRKLEKVKFLSDPTFNGINIIVNSIEELNSIITTVNNIEKDHKQINLYYDYHFDLEGEVDNKISFASTLKNRLIDSIGNVEGVEDRNSQRQSYLSIFGSLYFIGIFLGTLFMVATVLIIYYKQISEGYEDRHRFKILQEVGMSKDEVKNSIRSQILLVFFLPLVTAIIHIMVAFPLVSKILAILNLNNTKLFLTYTGIVILVFSIVYSLVYKWTSKVYYKIVN